MLWLFVGCLAFTAAAAVVTVLTGVFNEFVARVLGSSASISAASICGMACAAFAEHGRRPKLGVAGIVLSVVTLALALVTIWTDSPGEAQLKLVLVMVVWAVAVAHAELLTLPSLAASYGWVQLAAVAMIATLALLLTWIVYDGDPGEAFGRLLAVNSILVALFTLVVPVLWKIGGDAGRAAATKPQMVLTRGEDGVWEDASGARYVLQRLEEDRGS
jgi:hypothetical protein